MAGTNKVKLKKSQKLTKFGQFLYFTIGNFNSNNLWESASSCSFGFIFSFIPVTLIIITILLQILKLSPGLQDYITVIADEIETFISVDFEHMMSDIMKLKTLTYVDFFLALWVIWMARKLFTSIIQALSKIFRSVSKRKSWFNQLMTFICEFLIVIAVAALILIAFAFNKILDSSFMIPLQKKIPLLFNRNSHLVFTITMYFMLYIITMIIYRVVTGTKPKMRLCSKYAIISTVVFYLFSIFLNHTVNFSNYNAIYGALSTIVLLMVKVYFFFVIALFCAQMIYVSQFFDTLLKTELYLLPDSTKGKLSYWRKKLFSNPAALKQTTNTVLFKAEETIFTECDESNCVYFIRRGSVKAVSGGKTIRIYPQGSFLGDLQCILHQDRIFTAVAAEDCKMIIFSEEEFMSLIYKNPKLASKAISKVSDYTMQSTLS